MQPAVSTTRLLILVAAIAAVLFIASPFTAEAAARQFCSPNEDVCFSPLDCCSGQCVNAVCCDELLGTCNFDYFGPQWKRGSNDASATVTTPETEEPTTPTTEHDTREDEDEEATTQNSVDQHDSGSDSP